MLRACGKTRSDGVQFTADRLRACGVEARARRAPLASAATRRRGKRSAPAWSFGDVDLEHGSSRRQGLRSPRQANNQMFYGPVPFRPAQLIASRQEKHQTRSRNGPGLALTTASAAVRLFRPSASSPAPRRRGPLLHRHRTRTTIARATSAISSATVTVTSTVSPIFTGAEVQGLRDVDRAGGSGRSRVPSTAEIRLAV